MSDMWITCPCGSGQIIDTTTGRCPQCRGWSPRYDRQDGWSCPHCGKAHPMWVATCPEPGRYGYPPLTTGCTW